MPRSTPACRSTSRTSCRRRRSRRSPPRAAGIGFATLTHAAGLSSTGDAALDQRLPFEEPYRLPAATVAAIAAARASAGRVIAIGTTVTRALEHAATVRWPLTSGDGIADQRIGPETALRVVDAIVSGTHEPGTSHHALLGAFVPAATLARIDAALESGGYRTHEFGDSVLIEHWRPSRRCQRPPPRSAADLVAPAALPA